MINYAMRYYDQEIKKCVKEHKCYGCKKIIDIGSKYFIISFREHIGSIPRSLKICPDCYNKLPDEKKKPPKPKKPRLIERKPRIIKLDPNQSISQHEVELLHKEADIRDLKEDLERLILNIKNREEEARFYKKQIETAKKRGKTHFDRNKFLHKREIKNVE